MKMKKGPPFSNRPQAVKTGKVSGPKGVKTPPPKGGTRTTRVGNPKDCP
jgi:hypothetical protein